MNQALNRAVFLDRDGVINRALVREGKPYPPTSADEFEILPGVPEAIENLREAGFLIIVVTNQPDVSRGTLQPEAVKKIHDVLRNTICLDDILVCYDDGDAPRKKPNPGMLFEAAEKHSIELRASYMIGDRWKDILAGQRASCTTILIDYGYQERQPDEQPNFVAKNLKEASEWIQK